MRSFKRKKTYSTTINKCLPIILEYPPFQEHIFQNNICQEAMNLIKNDPEEYVRATALKSLQPMVGITLLWERCAMPNDLLVSVNFFQGVKVS